jgi:hypothetical protein
MDFFSEARRAKMLKRIEAYCNPGQNARPLPITISQPEETT